MKDKQYLDIQAKAIWYVERYATSSENLRKYLIRKVRDTHLSIGSNEIIVDIIREFQEQKIINDKLFADGKLRNLILRGWSINKSVYKLKQLGIADHDIELCINEMKNENNELDLYAAARLVKKRSLGAFRRVDFNDKVKTREFGIMSRAGFSYSICKKLLIDMDKEQIEEIYER